MTASKQKLALDIEWLYLKSRRKITHILFSKIYRDTNCDMLKTMIIAGVGRSGTTWLANIIASQLPCRILWEPFNPHTVETFSRFKDFQYRHPIDLAPDLYAYTSTILKGNIRHKWVDREINRIFFEYRIVKEIRANLFLNWLHHRFPDIPLLFIVRHPCAVVASRMEAKWGADEDLNALLSQPNLADDFLRDKMDIINRANTIEARHAILWTIQHLVPIRQFSSGQLNTVFYENLCLQPEVEIPRIFQIMQHKYRDSVFEHIERPSRTITRQSAIMTGANKVTRWKKRLSRAQVNNILSVVRDFGLDYIYGDSCTPLVKAL